MRDDRTYLEDIVEAIKRIEKYAAKGRTVFDADVPQAGEKPVLRTVSYRGIVDESAGVNLPPLFANLLLALPFYPTTLLCGSPRPNLDRIEF